MGQPAKSSPSTKGLSRLEQGSSYGDNHPLRVQQSPGMLDKRLLTTQEQSALLLTCFELTSDSYQGDHWDHVANSGGGHRPHLGRDLQHGKVESNHMLICHDMPSRASRSMILTTTLLVNLFRRAVGIKAQRTQDPTQGQCMTALAAVKRNSDWREQLKGRRVWFGS